MTDHPLKKYVVLNNQNKKNTSYQINRFQYDELSAKNAVHWGAQMETIWLLKG